MKILIDCTQIARKKAGVGVYAENLINQLLVLESGIDWFLLVQDDDPDFNFRDLANVTVLRISGKLFRKLPFRFLMEQLYIPFLVLRHRFDVVHSLHYSFPLLPMSARKVVTIHDMTMFIMPEMHLKTKVRYFQFFIRASSRRADQLVFDSFSSQKDYLARFSRDTSSCHVVHLGKSPLFRPNLDPAEIRRVITNLQIREPYILYVGTIEPRKNLTRLVQAFSNISATYPDYTLVIAGMKGWMYQGLFDLVQELGLESRVTFTGFIAEADKPFLIRGATVFAYPSLYEGFGIPLLEALACGVPTLTGNTSSLPEIAGDAALQVNPESVSEITDGLRMILGDPSLRSELIRRSLSQAAHFNWTNTARETLGVYTKAKDRTSESRHVE